MTTPLRPTDSDERRRHVELTLAFDDERDPSAVTIFPESCEDVTTTWMTFDVGYLIDLDDAA